MKTRGIDNEIDDLLAEAEEILRGDHRRRPSPRLRALWRRPRRVLSGNAVLAGGLTVWTIAFWTTVGFACYRMAVGS